MNVNGPSSAAEGAYETVHEAVPTDTWLSVQVPNEPEPLGESVIVTVPVGVVGVPPVISTTVTVHVVSVVTGTFAPLQGPVTVVWVGSRTTSEALSELPACAGSP